MMHKKMGSYFLIASLCLGLASCKLPSLTVKAENGTLPGGYGTGMVADTTNTAGIAWQQFFTDTYLKALIDTALSRNQELNIILQEIEISRNEIRARKGEYLPTIGLKAGAGIEKVGRYTSQGAADAAVDMTPGRKVPEVLPDYLLALQATWEVDIWHKLRNAKKAAVSRYLATIEGKNFMVTSLVAEIASTYYELLALDNQLDIVTKNIAIQHHILDIVKQQKEATRVTELAVRRFEALVLNTEHLQYGIRQQITETENRINFLLGRYPQAIPRNNADFDNLVPETIRAGIPAQLLANRPDIKQAEQELAAAKLDVKVARARFYPSLGITASVGYGAFNPAYLIKSPESLLYTVAGDLAAPLINRNAIKASYLNANAKQVQAIYNYDRTLLQAYLEVVNQLSRIDNLEKSYDLKHKEVTALSQAITISKDLFNAARADYMEVLMTQRDALEAKFELIETKKEQMNACISIYQALGGGWK